MVSIYTDSSNSTTSVMLRYFALPFATVLLSSFWTFAQEETPKAAREVGKPAPALSSDAQVRLAFPSPYPRLLGIESALKKKGVTLDWNASYQSLAYKAIEPDQFKDKSTACFAIGVRISDGIIALMAKDTKKLESVAKDLKALASKAGVNEKDMPSHENLLSLVKEKNWAEVQFELGMIQQEIVGKLDTEEDRSMGAVIASGAWLQGVRYATSLILKYKTVEDLSNMLRAAPMAELIQAEIKKTKADILTKPAVQRALVALAAIHPIIDVARDQTIPTEKLEALFQAASESVDKSMK
jgi:hypothetical protein